MSEFKLKINSIYLIPLVFLFIFGPVFNRIGSWADSIFFLSILLLFLNLNSWKVYFVSFVQKFYILFFLFLIISIRALYESNITFEALLNILLRPIRILFTLSAGYFISRMIEEKLNEDSFVFILHCIFYSIFLHSLVMIFQFTNSDFRDYIYSYTTNGDFRSSFEYEFRMGGFSGTSGGAVLSVVQSLGIIIAPFLSTNKDTLFQKVLLFVLSFFILVSIILSGRSGIYTILFFLPISFFLTRGLRRSIFLYLSFISAAIILFILAQGFIKDSEYSDFYNSFYRTFDTFINFQEQGDTSNETVDILKDHILFPDIVSFLVGNNEALLNTQFDRKLDSDIGYVRNIFSFGFLGFILFIFPILNLFVMSYNNLKVHKSYNLLFLLLAIALFFHFKESFLYVRMFWSIISIVIGYIIVKREKNFI